MSQTPLIKTQWLYDFLLEKKLVKASHFNVYGQNIKPSSCEYGTDTSYNINYTCHVFIRDYARELPSLILVINEFLTIHSPNRHATPNIEVDPASDDVMDVLITFELSETHRYIECPESEAEGSMDHNEQTVFVKLDRSKPEELMDLEWVRYKPFKPRVDW